MVLRLISGQFPTKIVGKCEAADFVLTETVYNPNQKIPKHSHENANFVIVVHGSFTEYICKKSRWCATSNVIFRPPGETHENLFNKAGGRCLTVEIAEPWWNRAFEHAIVPKDSGLFHNGLLGTIAARLYAEFRDSDSFSALAIEGLTLEMIAEVSRLSLKKPLVTSARRIDRAKEIIHECFADNLTLSSIAESVGLHPVYLARSFRHRHNCAVGEYIRHLRIQFACRELARSDATIAEIGSASGFFDQSHFSRTFKKLIGVSPGEYRKNAHRS